MSETTTPRLSLETQADSGVYTEKAGYQRTTLLSHRTEGGTRVLIKVDIRVDRLPGDSYFIGSVWTSNNGWVETVRPHSVNYWHSMPGYERAKGSAADHKTRRATYQIAEQTIHQLYS